MNNFNNCRSEHILAKQSTQNSTRFYFPGGLGLSFFQLLSFLSVRCESRGLAHPIAMWASFLNSDILLRLRAVSDQYFPAVLWFSVSFVILFKLIFKV